MVGTATVQATFNQLTALATADRTSPRWSSVIAAISDHMPPDAYVTAIRASVDSVQIDGKGKDARAAFEGLVHTPLLVNVRMMSAKRVSTTDGPPLQEFHVGAKVAPRVVPAPRPVTKPSAKRAAK
jgi:hypothetical protein